MTFVDVMLVLREHKERFEAARMPVSDNLIRTLDHVTRFTQFRTKESASAVREWVSASLSV